MIDFRSDTVTRPSVEMLNAMKQAPTGDDVFGDDPTVNALEDLAARMFGKEKALYCSSGTMTNQIAIKVHTQPGEEVICDRLAHIYNYEGGEIAFNSGCSARLLEGDRGRFNSRDVELNLNPDDPHYSRTSLVLLNTRAIREVVLFGIVKK
ncbi:MAG: threonine aldolase [Cellvibrionaceae bacterium]|jgi:threonine aldolase